MVLQAFTGVLKTMTIEITRHHIDYHSGQHDFVLIAQKDGTVVGHLDYSVYEGEPSVKMIEVELKRQRVGTNLVLALQELHPESMIKFGMTTEEGQKLLDSMEWNVIPNPLYDDAVAELAALDKNLEALRNKAAALETASQADRDAFILACEDWNDMEDRADELRKTVSENPAVFRFAVGGKTTPQEVRATPTP